MKLGLVIHTCSNEHVAQAAVLSIGGELAASVAVEATRRGSSVGKYVARAVVDFEQRSDLFQHGLSSLRFKRSSPYRDIRQSLAPSFARS